MIKKIQKKLKSKSGESLGETLVALLIAALALTMLAGAIAASARVITRSREKVKDYYEANDAVVQRTSQTYVESGITITDPSNAMSGQSCKIAFSSNGEFGNTPVVAYQYLTPTPTPTPLPAEGD